MQELAVDAVRQVMRDVGDSKREVEIKKYAKVEKIPGGSMQDCRVLKGIMFQKDVVSPDRMRRSIKNPRILLLDCPLEYKKGENQTAVELVDEADFAALLQQEEEARFRFFAVMFGTLSVPTPDSGRTWPGRHWKKAPLHPRQTPVRQNRQCGL